MADLLLTRTAKLSACGTYRYTLSRDWDARPNAVFAMLNPSTADHEVDDPTIRRCMAFARSWGYGGVTVINLFAVRSKDPAALYASPDPVGPENHTYIQRVLDAAEADGVPIICAWGTHGDYMGQDLTMLGWIEAADCEARALGVTKDGHPKHPLYLRADAKPLPYKGRTPHAK